MYDTKSRELRWNATFSEYSAPLCEESYHYSEWELQQPQELWESWHPAPQCPLAAQLWLCRGLG